MASKVLCIALCVLLAVVSGQNPSNRGIANPSVSLAGQTSIPASVNNGPPSKRKPIASSVSATVAVKKPKTPSASKVVSATAAQNTNRQAADQLLGLNANQLNRLFNMFQNIQNSNTNSNTQSTVRGNQAQGAGNRLNQKQNRQAPFIPVSHISAPQTSAQNQFQPNNHNSNTNLHGQFLSNVVYPVNNHISYYQTDIVSPSFNMNIEHKYKMLEEHNKLRQDARAGHMNVLRWNETLAAKAWLDVKDCDYKNKGNGAIQAMIHEKKTGTSMVSEAVSRWADEKNEFVLGVPCNYKNTCRYSQLVWADSQEVGCARQKCNDMSFISCMYSPPGNQAGRTAYIVGQPCSMCVGQCNTDHLCEWSRFPNTGAQQQQQQLFPNPPMFQQPYF